jgi:hypothetical protein
MDLAGWTFGPLPNTRHHGTPGRRRGAGFPTVSQRIMPARATVRNDNVLPYYFDLDGNQRASLLVPQKPANLNVRPPGVGLTYSFSWVPEQKQYLFELVWLGMLLMNRPLTKIDFNAVAEALHRQFAGTFGYPIRGVNTLHCCVVKDTPGYAAFVNQVLP